MTATATANGNNNNNNNNNKNHASLNQNKSLINEAEKLTPPPPPQNWIMIFLSTITDVVIFLTVSLGYIVQDWFYRIFGFPEKDLNGDIALITGGGGGLGRLLALRLCKLNVHIVIWDINQKAIDETVKAVKCIGGKCIGYKVDIANKEDVYRAADEIRRDVGDVTLLINNAGVVSGRAFLDTPDYLIERSFNVNVLSHFWTTKAFLPAMLEKDHGHIVTIASLAGHVGISKLVDYCSSKFAAVGFDEALRLELENLGSYGVLTTCICPFFIQSTGMFDDVNSRWVPTLNSENVADRIVTAIKKKQKLAVIPSYLLFMLTIKWIFPWGCIAGFLRRIVPDAAPQNGLLNGMPHINNCHYNTHNKNSTNYLANTRIKNNNINKICNNYNNNNNNINNNNNSSSNNNNNNNINNNNKVTPILVQRMPSVGERVL